ncbi:MAG TPA: hypothetical protein VNM92_10635 [Thermoanaerobaculia bacterium]|nr:hypothetical protein [Thermoanaerobaculia bacterium]
MLSYPAQIERTGAPLNLGALYEDVRKILHSIPQKRFGFSAEESEELVQEAWCLFMQKQESVTMPKPRLAGTMANLCKQQIHFKTRSRTTESDIDDGTGQLVAQNGARHPLKSTQS